MFVFCALAVMLVIFLAIGRLTEESVRAKVEAGERWRREQAELYSPEPPPGDGRGARG